MMHANQSVKVDNIHKDFGEVYAVKGIDFSVNQGEIFGLLGPNGAGKSTTISMIAGLIKPDQGQITVAGFDVDRDSMQVKSAIGVVPQEVALYDDLSARENLVFWGKMYGLRGKALASACG
jgi:ABC-2 type transport system ATP-binding protein